MKLLASQPTGLTWVLGLRVVIYLIIVGEAVLIT